MNLRGRLLTVDDDGCTVGRGFSLGRIYAVFTIDCGELGGPFFQIPLPVVGSLARFARWSKAWWTVHVSDRQVTERISSFVGTSLFDAAAVSVVSGMLVVFGRAAVLKCSGAKPRK